MIIESGRFTVILSCALLINLTITCLENIVVAKHESSLNPYQYTPECDSYSFDTPTSFAILVNFGRDGQQRNLYSSHSYNDNCDENQVWDPFSKQCRQIYCKDNYELHNFQCVENSTENSSEKHSKPFIKFLDSSSEFVNVTLGFSTNHNITPNWFLKNRPNIEYIFCNQFSSEFTINQTRLINITSHLTNINNIDFDFLIAESQDFIKNDQILAILSSYIAHRSEESISKILKENVKQFFFQYNNINFIANKIHTTLAEIDDFCIEDDKMPIWYWNSDFSINIKDNKTCIVVHSTGRLYEPGEYIGSILLVESIDNHGKYRKNASSNAVVCEKTLIDEDCPRILLNRSEYEFKDGQKLVSLNNHHEYDEYEFSENSSVFICFQESSKLSVSSWIHPLDSKIESYLSTTLMLISLILLSLVLLTYVATQSLRSTVNGFNTINLVICLMMMQLTFLTNQFINDCQIFTVVFHFFILSTISWSCNFSVMLWLGLCLGKSVIAFDIHRVFVSSKYQNRSARSGPVRMVYLISAYSMPFIIIIIAKIGDWFNISEIRADYGRLPHNLSSVCWMRSKYAHIYYFIIPVTISVIFNLILYLRIVFNIHSEIKNFRSLRKVTRINSGSSDTSVVTIISLPRNRMTSENECKLSVKQTSIYIRLSVPLGFTWIIALFSTMIPSEYKLVIRIMTYLFILANTSQGVTLFIAFGIYRRIWNIFVSFSQRCFVQ